LHIYRRKRQSRRHSVRLDFRTGKEATDLAPAETGRGKPNARSVYFPRSAAAAREAQTVSAGLQAVFVVGWPLANVFHVRFRPKADIPENQK